jgi:hypothetical protein
LETAWDVCEPANWLLLYRSAPPDVLPTYSQCAETELPLVQAKVTLEPPSCDPGAGLVIVEAEMVTAAGAK